MLIHFQEAADKKCEDIISINQREIESHKSEYTKITADLAAQKEAHESSMRELLASHQANVDKLTSTTAAALADAESNAKDREAELQRTIEALHEAVAKAQNKMIVIPPPSVSFLCIPME